MCTLGFGFIFFIFLQMLLMNEWISRSLLAGVSHGWGNSQHYHFFLDFRSSSPLPCPAILVLSHLVWNMEKVTKLDIPLGVMKACGLKPALPRVFALPEELNLSALHFPDLHNGADYNCQPHRIVVRIN